MRDVQKFESELNFTYSSIKKEFKPTCVYCHEELEIYVHYRGTAFTLIGDAIYPLEENAVVVIRPYVLHKTHLGSDTTQRTLLNVRRSMLDEYAFCGKIKKVIDSFFSHEGEGACILQLSKDDFIVLERIFALLDQLLQNSEEHSHTQSALCVIQALILLSGYVRKKQYQKVQDSNFNAIIQHIMNDVKENLTSSFSMEGLARRLGYNKHYLCHLFKEHTGTTILKYTIARKITMAQQYILTEKYSIAEISGMLGFSSSSHFSGTFKSITGMTPTEYARKDIY